jgi:hypothetical protein
MKKIFLFFAAVCSLFACNPTHEDISNGGHMTVDELKAVTSVTVNTDPSTGLNGNVITCKTSAPVNAKWTFKPAVGPGKDVVSYGVSKKMALGEYTVTLTALCADGTMLTADYPITCQVTTDPLVKVYLYGENPADQPPFTPNPWDMGQMRFSDFEGAYLPYITDEVYENLTTIIFDIAEATEDCKVAISNGWWSNWYYDTNPWSGTPKSVKAGLFEVTINDDINKECSRKYKDEGGGKDLALMVVGGSCTINSVYYEE